ncbi:DUF3301 domain-containing protein [Aliidiomarina celeris]|uniref:DUF3301 domain-containing protein n=1 Tax=Aliidiomarina celeris TaxID=2249428 RepID=UPI000DE91B24|nr:DUF3301 domain-containing protein [Aliidiomarina celeris]
MVFELLNVLWLLCAATAGALFWNWRRQDEWARKYAAHVCKKNDLQLLDVARQTGRFRYQKGWAWQAEFSFGFSSDGESRYEGTLTLRNLHLAGVQLPPHRWQEPAAGVHYHPADPYRKP